MTLYLATASGPAPRAAIAAGELGQIRTPASGNVLVPGAVWGADNGMYGGGYPGDSKYLKWLDKTPPADRARCLFAVAPDVMYVEEILDGSWKVIGRIVHVFAAPTIERSRPMFPHIRSLGYPAALAFQDGIEDLDIPWGDFDVAFIAGTTAWKLSDAAMALIIEAKRRGKGVHVGRVNSAKRWVRFVGYVDSMDGTYLAYGPETNLGRMRKDWCIGQTLIPITPRVELVQ